MKKILIVLIFVLGLSTVFSQKNRVQSDVRGDSNKPTVYLNYVCQDKKKIYLRMYNNTIWLIGVNAEKSYFPTKKPILLGNGNKGYAIPNDEEIPIYYKTEKDELENLKRIKIPKREFYYPQGGGGQIATGDSILFSIPIEHLTKGLKIYVEFSYEWESAKPGDINIEPLHRVYFRGSFIGSANMGIESKLCKE